VLHRSQVTLYVAAVSATTNAAHNAIIVVAFDDEHQPLNGGERGGGLIHQLMSTGSEASNWPSWSATTLAYNKSPRISDSCASARCRSFIYL
jgi:hypothetical protein